MTMRNRKTIITAFVLCACLLIGVGYAAVTGSLNITGATMFYSAEETGATVHSAVKFKEASVPDAYKDVCKTSLTGDDTADLTITFVDTDKATNVTREAVAKYTVVYEASNTDLPDVTFTTPQVAKGDSECTYTFFLDEACTQPWTNQVLSPNATTPDTFEFWLKVEYTEKGDETGILKAFPNITLNYTTE